MLLAIVIAAPFAGCSTPGGTEQQRVKGDSDYHTGSNIPRRSPSPD